MHRAVERISRDQLLSESMIEQVTEEVKLNQRRSKYPSNNMKKMIFILTFDQSWLSLTREGTAVVFNWLVPLANHRYDYRMHHAHGQDKKSHFVSLK